MIYLSDLNEGSLLWNLKTRYENNLIYVSPLSFANFLRPFGDEVLVNCRYFSFKTYIGSILISVNPYKMFDIYNLNVVKKYENFLLGQLPP